MTIKKYLFGLLSVMLVLQLFSACDISNQSLQANHPTPGLPLNLQLDQAEAYVAISKNDDTGYNRAFPFYFYLETQEDYTEELELRSILNFSFDEAQLISSDDEMFFSSDTMAWASIKIAPHKFNVTLMVFLKDENLFWDGVKEIKSLVLVNKYEKKEFILPPYYVEARQTIPDDILYVSGSPMEAWFNDDLTVPVNWDISAKDISDFGIEWLDGFSALESYELKEFRVIDEEYETFGYLYFQETRDKVVFRPFIKVTYNDEQVYLVPTVPVFINGK